MRMISLTNASSVVEPDTGEQYDAGPDGVFDLPHPFAMHLADKHAGHWRVESEHEAAVSAAKVATLRNPNVLPGVVATLRDDLDAAVARIEALEAAAAKPTRAPTAAKKTAAKKTAAPKKTPEGDTSEGDVNSDDSGDSEFADDPAADDSDE